MAPHINLSVHWSVGLAVGCRSTCFPYRDFLVGGGVLHNSCLSIAPLSADLTVFSRTESDRSLSCIHLSDSAALICAHHTHTHTGIKQILPVSIY